MRIGSLFSGVGGLELGLEWSGIGETVWQVERDEYCLKVLERHWPHAQRFNDVRTVGASTLVPVDIICGGFPCQDVSSAGKRVGLAGARSGLWFEYLRIVSEIRPTWVVVENVASGARSWVDAVNTGLGEFGYACLPVPLAAADVGAPHERARVFIVATNANASREHAESEHAEVACASAAPDVVSKHLRLEPWGSEREGWKGEAKPANDCERAFANLYCNISVARPGTRRTGVRQPSDGHWSSAMPDMVRVVHGVSRGSHGAVKARPRQRIAALGNAVVPQCAEVIGHIIQELMSP